jgi:glucokinase
VTHLLGVDIGGTRMRVALVGEAGAVVARMAAPTPAREGPEAVVEMIAQLRDRLEAGGKRSVAAGVCAPGPIDTERGVALGVPTLAGWDGVPIAEMIAERLDLPTVVENDAIAAANGEWWFGAGRGLRNMVYVTLSTGVGGGAVVDGRLLHGRAGLAGHVGHMIVQPGGTLCSCGNRGCWEAYASGTAFTVRLRAAGFADAAAAYARADAGDETARKLIAEQGAWLGVGVVGLMHAFSPELVVLGGGVSAAFERFAPALRERVKASAMPAFRAVKVVPAALGDNCGLVGAAALAMAKLRAA